MGHAAPLVRAAGARPRPAGAARLRANLTRGRVRHQKRTGIEKIGEDALLKVSSVIPGLMGGSGRGFLQALGGGARAQPRHAGRARRLRLHASKAELQEALTGRFRDIHGSGIGMLLELIDEQPVRQDHRAGRAGSRPSWRTCPAWAACARAAGSPGPDGPCTGCGEPVLGVIARLDEIAGIGRGAAQVIVAELGTDMTHDPGPGHAALLGKADSPRHPVRAPARQGRRAGKATPTCAARPESRS